MGTSSAASSLQSQVKTLTNKAGDGLKDDLRMLAQTLDRLAERAAREVKELKADATIVIVEAEFSLRRAVEEAKSRLRVIQAKDELLFAWKGSKSS